MKTKFKSILDNLNEKNFVLGGEPESDVGKAEQEGYNAAKQKKSKNSNPYSFNSEKHLYLAWAGGYSSFK